MFNCRRPRRYAEFRNAVLAGKASSPGEENQVCVVTRAPLPATCYYFGAAASHRSAELTDRGGGRVTNGFLRLCPSDPRNVQPVRPRWARLAPGGRLSASRGTNHAVFLPRPPGVSSSALGTGSSSGRFLRALAGCTVCEMVSSSWYYYCTSTTSTV